MAGTGEACPQCGAALREGAKFCRACGAKTAPQAPAAVAGSCPACAHVNPPDSRFCRACGARLDAQAVTVAPAPGPRGPRLTKPEAPAPEKHGAAAPDAQRPAPRRASRRRLVIAAALVLILAAGGAAAALLIDRNQAHGSGRLSASRPQSPDTGTSGSASASSSTSSTAAALSTAASQTASPGGTPTTATAGQTKTAPAEPNPYQDVGQIQQVVRQHHEDIVAGDLRAAWDLTSPQYRAQKLAQPGGYGAWAAAQKSLQPYLVPAGLEVSIRSWDPQHEVATVELTGMGWTDPHSNCTQWSGITWVHYVAGQWYYEPGYSINPQRRAEWHAHFAQLLGGSCHDS